MSVEIGRQSGKEWLDNILIAQMAESLVAKDTDLSDLARVRAVLRGENFGEATISELVLPAIDAARNAFSTNVYQH